MEKTLGAKKIGVVRFPGTNCDRDVFQFVVAKKLQAEYLWHLDQFNIADFEALIIPGGFSYGDYLRAGALAAKSPVMQSVREFASRGGPVLGICNGFQVLVESHLLPGALVRNQGLRFMDDWAQMRTENQSAFWGHEKLPARLHLPIANGEGRFYASESDMKMLEDAGQVWLRYEKNPNGSLNDIAGVLSPNKKIAGLMPHPERALYDWMGSQDGWGFL